MALRVGVEIRPVHAAIFSQRLKRIKQLNLYTLLYKSHGKKCGCFFCNCVCNFTLIDFKNRRVEIDYIQISAAYKTLEMTKSSVVFAIFITSNYHYIINTTRCAISTLPVLLVGLLVSSFKLFCIFYFCIFVFFFFWIASVQEAVEENSYDQDHCKDKRGSASGQTDSPRRSPWFD